MTWRDELAAMKAEVHETFAIPVTIQLPGNPLTVAARHHRAGAVVGEEGYTQAIVTDDRLVFLLDDLEGNTLSRGIAITTPKGTVRIAEVMPPDINTVTVVVGA